MTQKTTRFAGNPIVLRDFDEAWASHVKQMALYHSMTLPLEDLSRVFGFHFAEQIEGLSEGVASSDYVGVKSTLAGAYGEAPVNYIQNLIDQINAGVRVDHMGDIISKGITEFKRAKTMVSASVVIQQPTAVLRAMAYIDPKYFLGTSKGTHKERWEELKRHAPIAVIKEMGGFDTGIGATTTDWLLSKEYKGIQQKAGALVKDKAYRDEVISRMPMRMNADGSVSGKRLSVRLQR